MPLPHDAHGEPGDVQLLTRTYDGHALADRRVNRVNMRREFFYSTPAEVREILATTDHARWVYEYRDEAEAEEWRTSQKLISA